MTDYSNISEQVKDFFSEEGFIGFWEKITPFLYGLLLLFVTYVVAKFIHTALQKMFDRFHVDKKISKLARSKDAIVISQPITTIAYYAVWLFALPLILEKFGFSALTAPINTMIEQILSFIPKFISALVIFAVFYFVANALRLITTQVFDGFGIDAIMKKIGLEILVKNAHPAKLTGTIVFIMLLLVGVTQSIQTLGLPMLTNIMNTVLHISGSVLFGAVIIIAGVFGANVVSNLITEHGGTKMVATLSRVLIIIFVGLTGIEQMGIQTIIITNAAQFVMGSIALGFAIAMGLGAKDTVGKLVADTVEKLK